MSQPDTDGSASLVWTLNPVQWDFVHCASRFSFYVGGLGAGKTTAGAMRAILRAVEHPGSPRRHRRANLSDAARRHRPHVLRAAADGAGRLLQQDRGPSRSCATAARSSFARSMRPTGCAASISPGSGWMRRRSVATTPGRCSRGGCASGATRRRAGRRARRRAATASPATSS